jgi:hypothetical protein
MPVRTARRDNCLRLPGHDDRGLVHAKAPGKRDFWFGRFFRIWGPPPGSTQLLERTAGAADQITAAENAQQFTGDRVSIVLEYAPLFGVTTQCRCGP